MPAARYALPLAAAMLLLAPTTAGACPFCAAAQQTLSEELAGMDVAVIAELIEPAEEFDLDLESDPTAAPDPDAGKATFRVLEVIKGEDRIQPDQEFQAIYFGQDEQKRFLVHGLAPDGVEWNMPLPLSDAGVDYIKALGSLPEKGPDRLFFFQQHLESADPLLAQNSYDEFARSPYEDVIALGPRMNRPQLVEWINNPEVGPTRRRLYLTMLGICGVDEDADMLERLLRNDYRELQPAVKAAIALAGDIGAAVGTPVLDDLLRADERRRKQCLDALIAAYLRLRGPEGLPLIEQKFLANPDAEYTQVYAAIMALRFHGQETDDIPKERLLESVRLLLDNEEIAEQVVPDLARWEDWSVLPKLLTLFRESDQDAWIRQPVVQYMIVAEEQAGEVGAQAAAALQELEELDPKCVKRARQYAALALIPRASGGPAKTATSPEGPAKPPQATGVVADTAEQETPPAKPAEPDADAAETPSTIAIVGIPLLAGLVLMGVYTLLLRAVDLRAAPER